MLTRPETHPTSQQSILEQWNVHKAAETQLFQISHPLQGCCIPPGGFAKALPHAALCRAPEVKIPICLLDQHWLPIFGNPSDCYKPYMHGLRGNPCSQLEQRALALMLRVWLGGSSWGTAKPHSSSCLHSSL